MRSPQELATAIRCAPAFSAPRHWAGESNFFRSAIRNNQLNRMDVDHECQLKQRGCGSPAPASCRGTPSARDCPPAAAQSSSISQPVREEPHAAVLGFGEMPKKNFRFSATAEASSATTNPSCSSRYRPIGRPELLVLAFFPTRAECPAVAASNPTRPFPRSTARLLSGSTRRPVRRSQPTARRRLLYFRRACGTGHPECHPLRSPSRWYVRRLQQFHWKGSLPAFSR